MERNIILLSCAKNFGGAERILWEINKSLEKKMKLHNHERTLKLERSKVSIPDLSLV